MERVFFFLFLVGLAAPSGFAQSPDPFASDQLMKQCGRAAPEKPYLLSSAPIQGPKGLTAQTHVRCWKEKDRYFALSELWVDGKKVYATPQNALALEAACGTAAGEVYKPHGFSPKGDYFAFLLIPFCWETEPLTPVVMLNQTADKKTKAPNFTPVADEIFKRYPATKKNKQNVEFLSSIAGWDGPDGLMIDVNIVCYGCFENGKLLSFPKSRWLMTAKEKFRFLSEIP